MKYGIQTLSFLISGMLLIGCGQISSQNKGYQANSQRILGNFSSSVSKAYGVSNARGITSALGITNSYYDPSSIYSYYSSTGGSVPYATSANYYTNTIGTYDINQNIQAESQACIQNYSQIASAVTNYQTAAQNFKPAIAQLTRCLNRLLVNRNPIMTYGYRNLNDQSQMLWSYLMNWRQPGTLQGFDINAFNGLLRLIPANGY